MPNPQVWGRTAHSGAGGACDKAERWGRLPRPPSPKPMKQELTAESVRHHFNYDPDTGLLTRRVSVNGRAQAGAVCATKDGRGFRFTQFAGKRQYVHRLALLHVYGQPPTRKVEHRNGQRGDTRLSNLVLGGKLK